MKDEGWRSKDEGVRMKDEGKHLPFSIFNF
jgi:hypothetical protein